MFEPYARGDHTAIPGMGVGLFASRRAIEAHGGDIWYEDGRTRGATFVFSLPLAKEQ